MKKAMVMGATSAIAQEVCRILAGRGMELVLAGRNPAKLKAVAADLKIRGAGRVETLVVDAADFRRHADAFHRAVRLLGGLDLLLIAHGELGDQERAQKDVRESLELINTNFLSVVSLATPAAGYFEERRSGALAVISSVAGLRGRRRNYLYGSAKAGLNAYLSGLRNRLAPSGARVLTYLVGFVDTPMTADLPKNFLFVKPGKVARGMVRALDGRGDVVYLPGFWRWIMLAIRMIPESLFKKMNI